MRSIGWSCLLTIALLVSAESTAKAHGGMKSRPSGTPPSRTIWVPTTVVRDECWQGGSPIFDAAGNLPNSPARPFVPLYDPDLFLRKYAPICPDCDWPNEHRHSPHHKR